MGVLTTISLILGALGSLPSVLYLVNRWFFRPHTRVGLYVVPRDDGAVDLTLDLHLSRAGEFVDDALLYFDAALCELTASCDVQYPARLVRFGEQARMLFPARLQGLVGYTTTNRCAAWVTLVPKAGATSTTIMVLITTHVVEGSLPPLIDMFPPRRKNTQAKADIRFPAGRSAPVAVRTDSPEQASLGASD